MEWRPVFCFEDSHQVSDDGKVRSVITGELLPEIRDSRGFICVTLPMPESRRRIRKRVCDLVWDSFCEPRESLSWTACHKDGNKLNNSVGNLKLKFINSGKSSLSSDDAVEILGRRMMCTKSNIAELATEFGVTERTIQLLLSGETHKEHRRHL